jgi:cell wall-associated NlpC family hydrolase
MSWVNTYVGMPYANHGRDQYGLDCWGLVQLVYAQELKIELPGFDDTYEDAEDPGDVMERCWSVWAPVDEFAEFDALVFCPEIPSLPTHVGLYLGGDRFVHCFGKSVRVSYVTHPMWRKPVLHGGYRYVG